MRLKLTLALLLCLVSSLEARAQKRNLNHLKTWAYESPLSDVRPRRDLFALPEVKSRLLALLGPAKYKRIYEWSVLVKPMDIIDGYLIAKGSRTTGERVI